MAETQKPILIVEGLFYQELADELRAGATLALEAAGFSHEVIGVPGALEVPAVIAMAIQSKKYAGFVALGTVIRGQTSHYDYVAGMSIRALQDLAIQKRAAIGTGILTVENPDQAWARAARDKGNKGARAAEACLSLIGAQAKLSGK
ncbi:MAG: 6,7-dimethyl-8-ribityllumazine synthase [Sphingomonadales bacterium]